ncbi:lipopolysaccharide biosynthesis protein [bacterium]|nr:lipopolysaccharide biosynthesis protein [bacterium]
MSRRSEKIVINTLALYVRMAVLMLLSLYTSRLVLNVLGVADFGLYNVIGGVVTLFSFLWGAMSSATQRFLSYELGTGNPENIRNTFSLCMIAHVIIALLLIAGAECVGVWFINTMMKIPAGRELAANVVFQCTLITLALSIIRVPYHACIISYEKMFFFSIQSCMEAVAKLLLALYLSFEVSMDRLILYAIGIMLISIFLFWWSKFYCYHNFPAIRFCWVKNPKRLKELLHFSGWSIFGSSSTLFAQQGTNVIVNQFFGVVVNASVGISTQVCGAINGFVGNFQMAFCPQIVKSYAAGEMKYLQKLVLAGAKYSFALLLLLALPLLINTRYVIQLWLGQVPEYAVIFIQLSLLRLLLNSLACSMYTAIQATGKIIAYQIWVSSILFLTLPLIYLAFRRGYPPQAMLVIMLALDLLALVVRVVILKIQIHFPLRLFFSELLLPVGLMLPMGYGLFVLAGQWPIKTFPGLIVQSAWVDGALLMVMIAFMIKPDERAFLVRLIKKR